MTGGLSIVIVNYNGERFLEQSIHSFQSFMEIHGIQHEFLVMDNASTDQSAALLKDLSTRNANIRVKYSSVNHGFGKANNILIREAAYPTLVLLNNDTLSVDLRHLCSLVKQSGLDERTVYTCSVLNADGSPQKNTFNYPRLFNVAVDLFLIKRPLLRFYQKWSNKALVIHEGYFSGCYLVLSKAMFNRVGGFDESFFFYHEECDLFLRLEALGIRKQILADQIIHYGSGGGQISDFSFKNYYINLARLLIKHRYGSPGTVRRLFSLGFSTRKLLLRLGFQIAYSPFANTYSSASDRERASAEALIALHQDTFNSIKSINV